MSTSSKPLEAGVLAPVITVDKVTKVFGRAAAVRETSFIFQPRKIYVLLGDNGAGKSTLLRMIAGLAQPTSGSIERNGLSGEHIGFMAHASLLYDELSGIENLEYFAKLYRLGTSSAAEQRVGTSRRNICEEAMTNVGLDPADAKLVRDYSQGMRQRLSLARAVLHSPKIILLDEPFSNVDTTSSGQMVSLIARMRDSGCTILLVTHQISVVKDIGDEFLTLRSGQIVETRRRSQLRPTEIH